MTRVTLSCSLFLAIFALSQPAANACSAFYAFSPDNWIMAGTQDWYYGKGFIIVNRANRSKTDFRYWEEKIDGRLHWVSKYASISINQYGHNVGSMGMNQMGLTARSLWLEEAKYAAFSLEKSLNIAQLPQYVLDMCATIDEIVPALEGVRIRVAAKDDTRLHFFFTDTTGQTLTLEYIAGKIVAHTGKSAPVPAITNSSYATSISTLANSTADADDSLRRFRIIAKGLASGQLMDVTNCTKLIESVVAVGGESTKYVWLYDTKNLRLIYRTEGQDYYKTIDAKAIFANQSNSDLMLPLINDYSGDISDQFIPYTYQQNEKMVTDGWTAAGFKNIYKPSLQLVAGYPDTFGASGAK